MVSEGASEGVSDGRLAAPKRGAHLLDLLLEERCTPPLEKRNKAQW